MTKNDVQMASCQIVLQRIKSYNFIFLEIVPFTVAGFELINNHK